MIILNKMLFHNFLYYNCIVSRWRSSCWLNFEDSIIYGTIIPTGAAAAIALIIAEAATMNESCPPLPTVSKQKLFAARYLLKIACRNCLASSFQSKSESAYSEVGYQCCSLVSSCTCSVLCQGLPILDRRSAEHRTRGYHHCHTYQREPYGNASS